MQRKIRVIQNPYFFLPYFLAYDNPCFIDNIVTHGVMVVCAFLAASRALEY